MSPKAVRVILVGLAILCSTIICVFMGLKYLAQKPPAFYSEMIQLESLLNSATIHDNSERLVENVIQLRNDVANDPEWLARFTEDELNAWLIENGTAAITSEIPAELSDLRIHFEVERIRVAFQWQGKPINSVISLELIVNCVGDNQFEIGVADARFGVLPVPWTRFQDEIQKSFNDQGLKAEWKVVESIPTLCFKIDPNIENRKIVIEKLTILDHEIRLNGKSVKNK